MRFSPPRVSLPVELSWLLSTAFGPDLLPSTGDPDLTVEWALKFDLAPRIVARHGATAIRAELGPAAGRLVHGHRRAVAMALAGEQTGRWVAELAAQRGLSVIFLKGFALQLMGIGSAGSRPFADLDVLLPRAGAAELREQLVAGGWVSAEEAGNPQHLSPVQAPEGLPVDIHFRLRGVRVASSRWATAEELLAARLCRPAGLGEDSWIPGHSLMAAHLAVHALEQHGHRPTTYPSLRAIADVADLAAGSEEDLETGARTLVCESLSEDELQSLFVLGRVLAEGRRPIEHDGAERAAAVLLRHIIAGVMDPVYRRGLAIDHTAERLRQARMDGELMRYIASKLKASGDAPAAGSTDPLRNLEYIGTRLLLPIQLGARLTSSAFARLRRVFHRQSTR